MDLEVEFQRGKHTSRLRASLCLKLGPRCGLAGQQAGYSITIYHAELSCKPEVPEQLVLFVQMTLIPLRSLKSTSLTAYATTVPVIVRHWTASSA